MGATFHETADDEQEDHRDNARNYHEEVIEEHRDEHDDHECCDANSGHGGALRLGIGLEVLSVDRTRGHFSLPIGKLVAEGGWILLRVFIDGREPYRLCTFADRIEEEVEGEAIDLLGDLRLIARCP